MSQNFYELLARVAPAEKPERREAAARELDVLTQRLVAIIENLGDSNAQRDILAFLSAKTLTRLENGATAIFTPDFLEWARTQYSDEEIIAGIREVQETGGLELKDFIQEITDIVAPND
jgi:hypothetical protein